MARNMQLLILWHEVLILSMKVSTVTVFSTVLTLIIAILVHLLLLQRFGNILLFDEVIDRNA